MTEPFRTLESIAVPLDRRNVDTDQIVPARFLSRSRSEGFGTILFRDLRFRPDGSEHPGFVLNDERYRGARILIARENFGSGSSRESAVYALWDYGIRVVIAPSFGDIFYSNAMKNGLLPIVLPAVDVESVLAAVARDTERPIRIDLPQQKVIDQAGLPHAFDIDPFRKHLLMTGGDELTYTLGLLPDIETYERRRAASRPWL